MPKTLCSCKNKSLPHTRSEIIAIKRISKIPVPLLPTDVVFTSRYLNNVLNSIHKRALRLI